MGRARKERWGRVSRGGAALISKSADERQIRQIRPLISYQCINLVLASCFSVKNA